MAKGKYARRADTRLRALEAEAVREAQARIKELEGQLAEAKHEINTAKAGIHSKAMAAAAEMNKREKQHLRDQLASLTQQHIEQRQRDALLVWEIVHRAILHRPAPLKLPFEGTEDENASRDLWLTMHWEIGALLCKDYDAIWEFFEAVEGYRWRIAGDNGLSTRSGYMPIKQSSREVTRIFKKGRIRDAMMARVVNMRAYYDRILFARQHGELEPILGFKDAHPKDACDLDTRDELVSKIQARTR